MGSVANFLRQMDILPPKVLNRYPYVIVGLGGIGSPIGFTISKMGVTNLTVWDHDTLESHNLPNQFYKLTQLGKSKAQSLALNLAEYAQVRVTPVAKQYQGETLEGIVISAVDKLEVRQEIWQAMQKCPRVPLYVETRMAGELFQIFPVLMTDPDRVRFYHERLNRKVKVHQAPCTAQAIFYTVMNCAGLVGEVVKTFLTDPGLLPKVITVDLQRFRMVIE